MIRRSKLKARYIPKLKRGVAYREPKRCFYLFCEGQRTEPDYFESIKKHYRNTMLKEFSVDVLIPYGGGVPLTIAQRAVKFAKSKYGLNRGRHRKNSFENNDEVWAIFDRDDHPNFSDAVVLCENNGIKVGRSNPCFEVWLILHVKDYGAINDSHNVQKIYSSLKPSDKKSRNNQGCFSELVKNVEDAEMRAEKQLKLRRQENNSYGNPSTTVGRLTKSLREANEKSRYIRQ